MSIVTAIKYRAFISYSHADEAWARWLQRRLEGFRIDADLAARLPPGEPVPKHLAPVFRDRSEFAAGADLTAATRAALEASAALIVIASPRSAISDYVNEEIRLFRQLHPTRPVIPVLVDGRNGSPDKEPYAPALRFELESDGRIGSVPKNFLGADVRDAADGRTLGLAKVVASLLRVEPDQVYRRLQRIKRQQTRIRVAVAVVGLCLLAVAGRSYVLFQQEQVRAENANNLKLVADSIAVAREMDQAIAEDRDLNPVLPRVAAALPDPSRGRIRPYVASAEAALLKGMQAQKLESTLLGHTGEITHIAASPDWQWIATASVDSTARIWSAKERRLVHVLTGHAEPIQHIGYDAKGERLFTAAADGKIGVWSVADGQRLRYLEGHKGDVTKLALSPDGRRLASAGIDGAAWIWDLSDYSGKRLGHLAPDWKPQLDNKGRPRFRVTDPRTGRLTSVFDHPQRSRRFATKGLGVTELIWKPDGKSLLTSGEDGRVVEWTVESGKQERVIEIDLASPVYAMIADFVENTIIVGTHRLGSIWFLDTQKKLADFGIGIIVPLPSGAVPLIDLKIVGDGRAVVGYGAVPGDTSGGVYLWNTRTGEFLTRVRPTETGAPVQAMDTIAGEPVLLEGVGTIPRADYGTYKQVGNLLVRTEGRMPTENVVRFTRFSNDNQSLTVFKGSASPVTATLLVPSTRHFIAGTREGVIHFWNANEKFFKYIVPVSGDPMVGVKNVAIADDGKTIVALNVASQLAFWHGDSGNRRFIQLYQSKVTVKSVVAGAAADKAGLLPGDRLLSFDGLVIPTMKDFVAMVQRSSDKSVTLTYERNGAIRRTAIMPVGASVQDENGATRVVGRVGINGEDNPNPARLFNAFRMSADGKQLVAGANDGQVLLWEPHKDSVAQVEPVPTTIGRHASEVTALAVDRSGRFVISGSDDGVRIFDLATKREVRHITHNALRGIGDIHLAPTSTKFMVTSSARSDHGVVFDTADPNYEFALPKTGLEPRLAVFLGNGERLAVAQGEPASGFKVFDLVSKQQRGIYNRDINSLNLHLGVLQPGNRIIDADAQSFIRIVDSDTLQVIHQVNFFRRPVHALQVSSDQNRFIAMAAGIMAIYDAGSGERLISEQADAPAASFEGIPLPDGALSSAASENGRFVASASRNLLHIYEIPATTQDAVNEFCRMQAMNPAMDGQPCEARHPKSQPTAVIWAQDKLKSVSEWLGKLQ